MIEDILKNRNHPYSESAKLLNRYRKLMDFYLDEENEMVGFRKLCQNKFVKFEIGELHEDEIC